MTLFENVNLVKNIHIFMEILSSALDREMKEKGT